MRQRRSGVGEQQIKSFSFTFSKSKWLLTSQHISPADQYGLRQDERPRKDDRAQADTDNRDRDRQRNEREAFARDKAKEKEGSSSSSNKP